MKKVVFIDRDGTLIEEPPDEQVDRLEKIRLMPGVIPALLQIRQAGYELVMVSNQDGLGTPAFPQAHFDQTQRFVLDLFASQGITFEAICICPHQPQDRCLCRKPATGLVHDYLAQTTVDREASYVVGDRDTDLAFARNLGVAGLRVRRDGSDEETWPAIALRIARGPRNASLERATRETRIRIGVDLDRAEPVAIRTGIGLLDHMIEQIARHGGFALELQAQGDLHVDEHHTVEDCALTLGQVLRKALGEKRGIARYGFVLPMDEAQARVALDLSGRACFAFKGHFTRERVGGLPTELVPHFFRSLADALGAALQIEVQGENAHHMIEACFKGVGRALRQAIRHEGLELPSSKGVL